MSISIGYPGTDNPEAGYAETVRANLIEHLRNQLREEEAKLEAMLYEDAVKLVCQIAEVQRCKMTLSIALARQGNG